MSLITDYMIKRARQELFPTLFRAVEVLHIFEPYCFSSDQFAHRSAAEQLAKTLPEELQKEFLDLANEKYKHLSNYSGD